MPHEKILPETNSSMVKPENDLVLAKLAPLRSHLQELVRAGKSRITLDLARVEVVDSSGIGLVVATHNSVRKTGGAVEVVNASRDILRLFQSLRIHQHLPVSGRQADAQDRDDGPDVAAAHESAAH